MRRQLRPADGGFQPGDKAFQNQRGFARAGNPRHHRELSLGNGGFQRLYGVDSPGAQQDAPFPEQLLLRLRFLPGPGLPGKEGPDEGRFTAAQVRHRPLGRHLPAPGPGLGAHFNNPVRL